MCVWMYLIVCVCTYVYEHKCICIYVFACAYMVCIYVYVYMRIGVRVYMFICVFGYESLDKSKFMIYVHKYICRFIIKFFWYIYNTIYYIYINLNQIRIYNTQKNKNRCLYIFIRDFLQDFIVKDQLNT